MSLHLLGLRTAIYPALISTQRRRGGPSDWDRTYFDQPFYVGYSVAGYELALMPDADPADGVLTYWGVEDVHGAVDEPLASGAVEHTPAADVGDGITTATVRTPDGNIVGLIRNPPFAL